MHPVIAGLLYDHIYKREEAALNDPIGLSAGLLGKRSCSMIKYACKNRKRKKEKWQVPQSDSVTLKTVGTVKIIMWRC